MIFLLATILRVALSWPPGKPTVFARLILGDPGADSGGEGKSKRAEKYGSKEK